MLGCPKPRWNQSSVEHAYNTQLLFHQTFVFVLHLPKRWSFYPSERVADRVLQQMEPDDERLQ